jgi:hypothetical protein
MLDRIIAEGRWNVEAGGLLRRRLFPILFWHCANRLTQLQPAHGSFRIDVIDTWNMTIESVAESASGAYTITLPGRNIYGDPLLCATCIG